MKTNQIQALADGRHVQLLGERVLKTTDVSHCGTEVKVSYWLASDLTLKQYGLK